MCQPVHWAGLSEEGTDDIYKRELAQVKGISLGSTGTVEEGAQSQAFSQTISILRTSPQGEYCWLHFPNKGAEVQRC